MLLFEGNVDARELSRQFSYIWREGGARANFLLSAWIRDCGRSQVALNNYTRDPGERDADGGWISEPTEAWRPIINSRFDPSNEDDIRLLILVEAYIEPRFQQTMFSFPFEPHNDEDLPDGPIGEWIYDYRRFWLREKLPNLSDLEGEISIHNLSFITGVRNDVILYIGYGGLADWSARRMETLNDTWEGLPIGD